MFHEEYTALCNAGVAKNNLLKKNPLGYFISSMVAGMFISFGSMVAFVLGQSMDGNGAARQRHRVHQRRGKAAHLGEAPDNDCQ